MATTTKSPYDPYAMLQSFLQLNSVQVSILFGSPNPPPPFFLYFVLPEGRWVVWVMCLVPSGVMLKRPLGWYRASFSVDGVWPVGEASDPKMGPWNPKSTGPQARVFQVLRATRQQGNRESTLRVVDAPGSFFQLWLVSWRGWSFFGCSYK